METNGLPTPDNVIFGEIQVLFHWDDTYRISPKAITPPRTILTASPPVDGAVPMLTRYIRPRISALIKRIPSTAPHFFIVRSDKPPRL